MPQYSVSTYRNAKQYNGSWIVGSAIKSVKHNVYIDCETTPSELCRQLKLYGHLSTYDQKLIQVSDMNSDVIEVMQRKDKRPLCKLELIH